MDEREACRITDELESGQICQRRWSERSLNLPMSLPREVWSIGPSLINPEMSSIHRSLLAWSRDIANFMPDFLECITPLSPRKVFFDSMEHFLSWRMVPKIELKSLKVMSDKSCIGFGVIKA